MASDETQDIGGRDERIGRIIGEYSDRKTRGEPVSEQEYLDRYPEFTAELREHFEILASLRPAHGDPPDVLDAQAATPPAIPGYKIVREIGRGGMGIVYEARDLRLSVSRAIKTIFESDTSETQRKLFVREAQLAARLRHPNIVSVHAFLDHTDPPCLVMDLVDGVPLTVAARHISYVQKAELMEKVARAVHYAHEMDLVHRDLKPSNILVDRTMEPRILDFGLAHIASRLGKDTTLGGRIKGTPAYMAPEQIRAPQSVDSGTDVFALGLILHELLTGVAPTAARVTDGCGKASMSAERELALPREVDPAVPEALQRICLKACEPRPEDRYRSALHMAEDLRRFINGSPIRTHPKRYGRLLEDRVRAHVDEISHWEQDRLLTERERDSIQNRYLALLRTDSRWIPDARRIRPGPILVQLGGWFVVLSVMIWAIFYWDRLSATQRILVVGAPTVLVNMVAWVLWGRFSQLVALIFTVTGVLLTTAFWLVLFSELDLLEIRMADRLEPFPAEYFCNTQLLAATILALLYAVAWVCRKPFALLSAAAALLSVLSYSSILLRLGIMEWVLDERWAMIALCWLPYAGIAHTCARRLDTARRDHLAGAL